MPTIPRKRIRFSNSLGQAGSYDRRILVQTKIETQSRSGAFIEDWDSVAPLNLAASFEPLGSDEFPIGQKRHSETTARFRTRYRTGINEDTNRISFAGRFWNVLRAIPIGRNVELVIEVSEIT